MSKDSKQVAREIILAQKHEPEKVEDLRKEYNRLKAIELQQPLKVKRD